MAGVPLRRLFRCCLVASVAPFAVACFPPTDGEAARLDALNFPVGVALSKQGDRLYVANSDFDLQYNSGSLLVLDAKRIRAQLPTSCWNDADCEAGTHCDGASGNATYLCVDAEDSPCGNLGLASASQRATAPGRCDALELNQKGLIRGAARIAPFATDLVYTVRTADDGSEHPRLLALVRGDATLHWAEVRDEANGTGPELDCGQENSTNESCDEEHRAGNDPSELTPQGDALPTEPSGLAVSEDGRLVLVGHQTIGKASIFVNGDAGPRLSYVLDKLATNPVGVAAVPPPRLAAVGGLDYAPGFLLTYRQGSRDFPRIDLVRYLEPANADPYLVLAASTTVTTNQTGNDCRGIAVDPAARESCEAACESQGACAPADASCVACLTECARIPLSVYVANRSPATLLVGNTRPSLTPSESDDLPDLSDVEALRGGPSRVYVNDVIGLDGNPERRVFVIAFDSQFLYVYDPVRGVVEMRIQTGRGPQSLAIDAARGLGYLAHLSDSYIGVIDLDRRHATYGQILLNVGRPTPPQSSK